VIKLEELNKKKYPTNDIVDSNLKVLCDRLNIIRKAFGKPMIVTSGLRSEKQQQELIKAGKSTATKSAHLDGMAADILDTDGELAKWCLTNVKTLEKASLWCEHPDFTTGWVHFQIRPPRSGNRFFKP
jgi:uncharacterized protein YcbK (DUF882 family)